MEDLFEGVFEELFEFFAEGFCELISSMAPQKNLSKKARRRIKFFFEVYAIISIVLLLAGLVILIGDPSKKFYAIIFISNFVLLLLAGIISVIIRKIRNKSSH